MKFLSVDNYSINVDNITAIERHDMGTRIFVRLSFDKEFIDTLMPFESVRDLIGSKDGEVPDANTALLKSLVGGQQEYRI